MFAALLLATTLAAARPPDPPLVVHVEHDVTVVTPDGPLLCIPAGTEIGAVKVSYDVSSRTFVVTPSGVLFRDGFESSIPAAKSAAPC